MKTLVIAEHDNTSLKTATLNAVAAAGARGGDVEEDAEGREVVRLAFLVGVWG